jgi:hypothetical protein
MRFVCFVKGDHLWPFGLLRSILFMPFALIDSKACISTDHIEPIDIFRCSAVYGETSRHQRLSINSSGLICACLRMPLNVPTFNSRCNGTTRPISPFSVSFFITFWRCTHKIPKSPLDIATRLYSRPHLDQVGCKGWVERSRKPTS